MTETEHPLAEGRQSLARLAVALFATRGFGVIANLQ